MEKNLEWEEEGEERCSRGFLMERMKIKPEERKGELQGIRYF